MSVFVLVLGILLTVCGGWQTYKKMHAWDTTQAMQHYRREIQDQQSEFVQQFKLTQSELAELYAVDFDQLQGEIQAVRKELVELRNLLKETKVIDEVNRVDFKHPKAREVWLAVQKGWSDQEIADQFNMPIGEVLLLKQLKK